MCSSSIYGKNSLIALIAISIIISGIDAQSPRRIVEGENADPNEFPWMAELHTTNRFGDDRHCGGAMLNSRSILTSANCVVNGVNRVRTRASNFFVNSNPAQIIVHPNFEVISTFFDEYAENDVAIVVLDNDLKLGANQAAMPLANKETTVGTRGMLSAWEIADDQEGVTTAILQKIPIDIQPNDQCVAQRAELLCGRSPPDATLCQGDSGSPLVVDGRVVGIISRSYCLPGRETMFTSVYYHLAWIKSNIEQPSV